MLIVSSYKYSLTPCPLSLFILEQPLRTGFSETLAPIPGKTQLHKRGSSQYAWHHLKKKSARSFTHGWIHHLMRSCEHFLHSSVSYLEATSRDVPTTDVHAGPGRSGVRELGGDGGHRAPRQVPLVPARRRPRLRRGSAEPTRVRDASESAGRLPRWKL